jgi:putative hydrolase of the HAD superfamily
MSRPEVTHVLLDFFGTLVTFSPGHAEQEYHATHALVRSLSADADYLGLLRAWTDVSSGLDQRSAADDSEYTMDEVAAGVLARLLGRAPARDETEAVAASFLREWNRGVRYPPGIQPLIAGLAARYRLAVVTPADAVFVGDTYAADYAGPVAAGMAAFLIDPGRRHDIPAARRLESLADLPPRLRAGP